MEALHTHWVTDYNQNRSIDRQFKHTCDSIVHLNSSSSITRNPHRLPTHLKRVSLRRVSSGDLLKILRHLLPLETSVNSPGKDTARITNPSTAQIDGRRILTALTAPCPPSQPLDSDPVSRLLELTQLNVHVDPHAEHYSARSRNGYEVKCSAPQASRRSIVPCVLSPLCGSQLSREQAVVVDQEDTDSPRLFVSILKRTLGLNGSL